MPALPAMQAAIFDMDGLIIDSEPLWQQAQHEVFTSVGVDFSLSEKMPNTTGLRIDNVVEAWFEVSPWQGESKKDVEKRIVERVIELIRMTSPLLPGVKSALELCKEKGLKIALASASPMRMLQEVLTQFNLTDYFDEVVSAQHLAFSKPHPEVYLLAAEKLDVPATQCISFEDSLNGMIAAKAARMRSIMVPAVEQQHLPQWSVADIQLSSLEMLTEEHLK